MASSTSKKVLNNCFNAERFPTNMVLISFDIGTKNFSYCVMKKTPVPLDFTGNALNPSMNKDELRVTILQWDLVDLMEHDTHGAMRQMHRWFEMHFDRIFVGHGVTHAVYEEQNDREKFTPRSMTIFAGALIGEMVRRGVLAENISAVPPSMKFTGMPRAQGREYTQTKAASVARTRHILSTWGVEYVKWINHLDQFVERDHPSDAFLQGLYKMGLLYHRRDTLGGSSEPEPGAEDKKKKRRTSNAARPLISSVKLDDLPTFWAKKPPVCNDDTMTEVAVAKKSRKKKNETETEQEETIE